MVTELTNPAAKDKGFSGSLRLLNKKIGKGPVPVSFFKGLVAVRDSVIHADNKIEWEFLGKKRYVPHEYANVESGEVEFTAEHLQEAIEKSVEQIDWYRQR
jgi:hypothetical protein